MTLLIYCIVVSPAIHECLFTYIYDI